MLDPVEEFPNDGPFKSLYRRFAQARSRVGLPCRERGENHLGKICHKCFRPDFLALYRRARRYAPTPATNLPRDMPTDEESRDGGLRGKDNE